MLKFSLKPSWLLAAILCTAHVCAIALVVTVDVSWWLKLVGIAALMTQCWFAVRRYALLQGQRAGIGIEVSSDHVLSVESRASGWREQDVLDSTYVTPYLTILNLRDVESRAATRLTLLPD